jgi:carboxylate-amine ligase
VDPLSGERCAIRDDVLATLARLAPHARALGAQRALEEIAAIVHTGNDARWMRSRYADSGSLADLVWQQVERLRGAA